MVSGGLFIHIATRILGHGNFAERKAEAAARGWLGEVDGLPRPLRTVSERS